MNNDQYPYNNGGGYDNSGGYNNTGGYNNNGGMNYDMGGGMNNGFQQGKPQNNLILAIITTIFASLCCCPIGLILGGISIYFAANVDNKWAMRAYGEAEKNAQTAKTLSYINIGLAVIGLIINIVYLVVLKNNPDIFQ